MFELTTDYPKAVASYDDEGLAAAIEWSAGKAEAGDCDLGMDVIEIQPRQ